LAKAFFNIFINLQLKLEAIHENQLKSMFFKKKLLSETEFSEKFAKKIIKKIDDLKIVSVNGLEVKCDFGGSDRQYFLDNAYSEYIREPKSIKEIMQKYLMSAFEMFIPEEKSILIEFFQLLKTEDF
jgi:hypothetical protein